MMTLLMSCSKKNGGGTMYLEFGANSGESKISYEGTSFKWSSADELSCYAGEMHNARFYNKYQNETSSAVFACDNATDWGTADFYTIYPYKGGGYTISEGKLSVTVPTTVAVGEDDYSGTMLFGKASSITPSQLYNTPITLNQVFSIVKVKIPAVSEQRATSVTISNSNAHLDSGRTLYKSGEVDATGTWTCGSAVGYIEYNLTGTANSTETVVNLPVIPTTADATYNVTVQYTNGTKLSTIYAKPINGGSNLAFARNTIYKIGFNDSGSKEPNQKYKYTVYDYLQTNPNTTRNFIKTGLALNAKKYNLYLKIKSVTYVSNNWYIGQISSNYLGFEIGELTSNGKNYFYIRNRNYYNDDDEPIPYQTNINKEFNYDLTCFLNDVNYAGEIFLLQRGKGNICVSTGFPSIKCFGLIIKEFDTEIKLLDYIPVKNNSGKCSMFDIVRGSFCTVLEFDEDHTEGYVHNNALTCGNELE